MDKKLLEQAIKNILQAIGEDPEREGLRDTPKRVAKMYEEIFSGLSQTSKEHLSTHFQSEVYQDIIMVKDISFYTMCEHHLLPFFGSVDIAYMPGEKGVLGLSKLARVVDVYAKRPQMQERLTHQIADDLIHIAGAKGAFVRVKARHFCMEMRGVQKRGAETQTQIFKGLFEREDKKQEILSFLI